MKDKLFKILLAVCGGAIVILVYHTQGEASASGLISYYIIVTSKLD